MPKHVLTLNKLSEIIQLGRKAYDGGGLAIVPATNGRNTAWTMNYTFHAIRKSVSLGQYPAVSLAAARRRADKFRELIATGIDPAAQKKEERLKQKEARELAKAIKAGLPISGTFEEVARAWFKYQSSDWGTKHKKTVIGRMENHIFPQIGARMVESIQSSDIYIICDALIHKGNRDTAKDILSICRRVFNYAVTRRNLACSPLPHLHGTLLPSFSSPHAAITDMRQLGWLCRDIYSSTATPVVMAALKLMPMIFLRSTEFRMALWSEIDLKNGIWKVPASRMKGKKHEKKNGDDHWIPLPTQAVSMLRDLHMLTGSSGRIFAGKGRDGFMSGNTINTALRRMGWDTDETICCHGFRATARTLLVEKLGVNKDDVERQLHHTVKQNNGHSYDRTTQYKQRKEMLQIWANFLDDIKDEKVDFSNEIPEFLPITEDFSFPGSPVKNGADAANASYTKLQVFGRNAPRANGFSSKLTD